MKVKIVLFTAMLALTGLSEGLFAQTVVAQGDCGASGNNLTWVITSGIDSILTISGNGAMADYSWDINNRAPWLSYSFYFLNIEEGVTTIGESAFFNSFSTQINIPSTLTSIGDSAFLFGCYYSTSFVSHAIVPPTLGPSTFFLINPNCTLYVPPGTREHYLATDWNIFTNIVEYAANNLAVTNVNPLSSSLQSGDEFSVSYTVSSHLAANSEWTDVVYFSSQPQWNINAVELSRSKKTRNVAALSTYEDTITCTMPTVVEGVHYLIVRCNVERALIEVNYADNIFDSSINVTVEPLLIDIAKEDTLSRWQQKLYKLTLNAGQNIRISDAIGTANIAIGYEQVPHISTAKQGKNYISYSAAGNYYVLVANNALYSPQEQIYNITATELAFGITEIFADTVVRYGSALIPLEIIGCNQTPQIELVGQNNVHYVADTVYAVSDILFSALFNVDTLELGNYSLYVSCDAKSDLKTDVIYIDDKTPVESFDAKIIVPTNARPGTIIPTYVEFINTGNIDIYGLSFKLTGTSGSTYQVANGTLQTDEIYLTVLNTMGINCLRPRELSRIEIRIGIPNQATSVADYMIIILPDSVVGDSVSIPIVISYDPNEKVGNQGIGNSNFIANGTIMDYTIFFENDSTMATAAAQEVRVTDTLDMAFDLSTFMFTGVQIGNRDISVSGIANEVITTDLRPENNLLLRTTLTMDIDTRVITAVFTSLDPETGEFTSDPLAGFLPPNNSTHRGEGHFSYRVNLNDNLSDNYEINNQAHIYFDLNAPISTNTTSHTIDFVAPTSLVSNLPVSTEEDSILVSWSGTDAGSGIKQYDVYVSVNRGSYTIWKSKTQETSAYFHGEIGNRYAFFSIATDKVGNIEAMKTEADAAINFFVPNSDAKLLNLTVSEGELTPVFNSDTFDYTVHVASSIASVIITATPNDTNARVDGNGLKQLQIGTNLFTVTVTAEDESTTSEYKINIIRANVGIEDMSNASSLRVYPNPTTGELRIINYEMQNNTTTYPIEVYDIIGKKQYAESRKENNETIIDISHLTTGVYFLKIPTEKGIITKKIMKK